MSIDNEAQDRLGMKRATRGALSELNDSFSGTYKFCFVDTLISHGGQSIQVRAVSNVFANDRLLINHMGTSKHGYCGC